MSDASKIVLILRDPTRKGKSVEEIYKGLAAELQSKYEVHLYYYSDKLGTFENVKRINKLKPDLIHITSDIYFLALFFPGLKSVITIHDIGRYRALMGIKKLIYKWHYFLLPGFLVNAIVVVSEFSKTELEHIYPKSLLKKVVVLHNPVPDLFKMQLKNDVPAVPVLLQVGTDEHKNLEGIIKAIAGFNCKLIIIGQLTDGQFRLLESNSIRFEQCVDLNYEQVLEKYVSADLVTFVSRYEGFGMPVIEAQAVGRPVMTSTLTSLPEIAGDGAYFIKDIYDVSEIKKGIQALLSDSDYRLQLVTKGTENVKRFSRSGIAQKYINLYSKILALS